MILKIIISYDFVIRVSSVAYINSVPEFSEKKKKKEKKTHKAWTCIDCIRYHRPDRSGYM